MKEPKTTYVCNDCDYHSAKWYGQCPNCGKWNTFEEQETIPQSSSKNMQRFSYVSDVSSSKPVLFSNMELPEYIRFKTGSIEFDRVLGGGLVQGSVVLLSGEPGIGKSTLLMQITGVMNQHRKILYVSGEESGGQLKLRADRLKIDGKQLYLLTETSLEKILQSVSQLKPEIIVIDSIQTIYSNMITASPGSITQVREVAMQLIHYAKTYGISILIVGHVNKEGGIAGPKALEHIVDAVLYFEGERQHTYRIIRGVKNRFGSTNEIGVFEMTNIGLEEVPNPSEMLLAGRPKNVSGNCAVCVMEGTRPLIAEIQALVSQTAFPVPKRAANGIDYNRLCLLLAVLEKRLGMHLSAYDAYMNVVGGLRIDEPAADLAIALALVSGATDRPLPDDLCVVGEIGLAGECRTVAHLEQRVQEAMRLGFKKIMLPKRAFDKKKFHVDGIEIIPVYGIYDAVSIVGLNGKKKDS